jgi:Adenylyl/Guanylyl and SMODS C-terminal sensor domain
MKKDKLNILFREYAKTLSPRKYERDMISDVYSAINNVLWINNCIQIGSYPRYTSITPVHDLDVLYFLWSWNEDSHDPLTTLKELLKIIKDNYKNPTDYIVDISMQTHSITISHKENGIEVFWVDIVPAYKFGKNEFWNDTYKVPEIIKLPHKKRLEKYSKLLSEHKNMDWILSDPRWYIQIASNLDHITNWEFRKTVKIIKKWKNNLCDVDGNLKFKSFHLEQIITWYFKRNPQLEIFDWIFSFFIELPNIIEHPNTIADRANSDKFIDDYLIKFTSWDKKKIIQARDGLLIKLEKYSSSQSINSLMQIDFYERSPKEQFLFDQRIPTFTDPDYNFNIYGEVQVRKWWFMKEILTKTWLITIDRAIRFWISWDQPSVDLFKWKVKNDDNSEDPRWEITDHRTLRDPEWTKYIWDHYVECYAILWNSCVAKARQNVKLER